MDIGIIDTRLYKELLKILDAVIQQKNFQLSKTRIVLLLLLIISFKSILIPENAYSIHGVYQKSKIIALAFSLK